MGPVWSLELLDHSGSNTFEKLRMLHHPLRYLVVHIEHGSKVCPQCHASPLLLEYHRTCQRAYFFKLFARLARERRVREGQFGVQVMMRVVQVKYFLHLS